MSAPARTGRGGQAGPALANGTAAAHTTGYLPDTSEYRKETDLGVGGGVAGDDGDGHGCSFRCGAGLLPGGGEVVGKVGGGGAPAAAGASDAEGAGFECRGGGVIDPADGVAVGVERVGAG